MFVSALIVQMISVLQNFYGIYMNNVWWFQINYLLNRDYIDDTTLSGSIYLDLLFPEFSPEFNNTKKFRFV